MPQLRSLLVAHQCLRLIGRHPTPGRQKVAQVIQAPVQTRIGRTGVVNGRLHQTHLAAPAMLQATPEHVVRHGTATLCSDTEPTPGNRGILLDATPIQQDLPQQQLRLDRALPRCRQNRLGGLARVSSSMACKPATSTTSSRRSR